MVIEGIITTESLDGGLHVAPIGPHVNAGLTEWMIKPFQTSQTFANLRRANRGVFHVVDDALLMARAVLGQCNLSATAPPATKHPEWGWVLEGACRVFALSVVEWDVSQERATANCRLESSWEVRPMWGWNRAANSILELCVLASRREWTDRSVLVRESERHRIIIEKTAGPREWEAWELLNSVLSQ